jgi:hypothetical protein
MRKSFIVIMIIAMISIMLTSCVEKNIISSDANTNKNKIQLWYYIENNDTIYRDSILKIIDRAKDFCEKNNIPLDVYEHNEDVLSYNDYIMKRNLAATKGNMIIIEDIDNMRDMAKYHADYSKLDNYNNLMDVYKGKFCIPLGVRNVIASINNEAIQYYGLSTQKPLITYHDYLQIKQDMKKEGARFELNRIEFHELTNYYMYKYEMLFLDDKSKVLHDNNLKNILKNIIIDVCNDIFTYYNTYSLELVNDADKFSPRPIYDENSGLTLEETAFMSGFLSYEAIIVRGGSEYISNKTFYSNPLIGTSSPSFFMYKTITNDKIYDLANYIVSEDTYLMIINEYNLDFEPVFKIEKAKEILQLNEKMEYVGDTSGSEEVKRFINTGYDMILNNKDAAQEMANGHFNNSYYGSSINSFIENIIKDIARELSGDKLSLENLDPNNIALNKMIDKQIDEFIINFNIYVN